MRYWLLNGTYVDLEVPYEKIGTPFDSNSAERAIALADYEKTKLIAELSKCEAEIRAGNLDMLELAVEICNRCSVPLSAKLSRLDEVRGGTGQGRAFTGGARLYRSRKSLIVDQKVSSPNPPLLIFQV